MKKYFLISFVVFCFSSNINISAQENLIEKFKVSTWFGGREMKSNILPLSENLDFLNYVLDDQEYANYEYLGFATQLWFKGKWQADLKLTLDPGFRPSSYMVKAMYFPVKQFGVSMGIFGYPQYINQFNEFHAISDGGHFEDTDTNYRQSVIYDNGFSAGIIVPLKYKFLHLTVQMNSGISSFSKLTETILLKEKNNNFKKEIQYKTVNSYKVFIYPEVELNVDCLKFKKNVLGLQMQTSWYKTSKAINYNRTTYNWTYENPIIEQVKNPEHPLTKFEIDFGLYYRWE